MTNQYQTHSRTHTRSLLLLAALLFVLATPSAQAKPRPSSISLIPSITGISLQNGNLVASGFVTATIKGTTTTVPFSGVPVTISLAGGQSTDPVPCPILDLALGPIHLNLLGLVVDTSPICLTITAFQGGGLLGDLLCAVAHLLDGGLTLNQILAGVGTLTLPGLTTAQLASLNSGLIDLLNAALQELTGAILTSIQHLNVGHTCAILHLELGPLDLTLLGLNVHLDNCANGPVTVDITAVTGRGNLLGNLLCELLDGGLLNLGATLQQILNQILGLLTA